MMDLFLIRCHCSKSRVAFGCYMADATHYTLSSITLVHNDGFILFYISCHCSESSVPFGCHMAADAK